MPPEQLTALVVDDNDAMRYAVGRMLRDAGFSILEAATGRDALQLAASVPDVVILDVNLPDISGVEVCSRIKTDPRTSSIPVIHLSAYSTDSVAQTRGLAAGADAYLSQPIPRQELLGTVQALLRTRGASPPNSLQQPEVRHLLEALREKNYIMATLVEACPLPIVALDRSGLVTAWNAAAEQVFGWSEKEVLGRPVPYLPHDRHDEAEWLASRNQERKALVGHQTWRRRKDGTLIEVSLSRAPLYDSRGELNGCIIVAEDITHRKWSERLLVKNEKLALAGQLAGSLAHEINNPLESITNVLYLLRRQVNGNQAAAEYLAMAESEVQRITSMTQRVLGFYRESAGETLVDLGALLDDVLSMFSRQLEISAIRVCRRYVPGTFAAGYAGELRQLFANLVANAVQAMQFGGSLLVHVAPGRNWSDLQQTGARVVISDTGPGIVPALRKKILEPFFTTKGDKGTGLGLWVVQGILRKHGGSLRMRSCVRPGRCGSCFAVFLPRDDSNEHSHP